MVGSDRALASSANQQRSRVMSRKYESIEECYDSGYRDIVALIHRSGMALDLEKFDDYMSLCTPEFHYQITAYSPEIRKEMIWMDQDYEGMKALLAMVPQHLRRLGSLIRHITVGIVELGAQSINVTSTVQVVHTDLNGSSSLFVAGRYYDQVVLSDVGAQLITDRRVHLETRDLGIGSHVPM